MYRNQAWYDIRAHTEETNTANAYTLESKSLSQNTLKSLLLETLHLIVFCFYISIYLFLILDIKFNLKNQIAVQKKY